MLAATISNGMSPTQRHGFTLVELSIVLAIIGLLVGGILAGQSLIRASELRSVIADATSYTSSVSQFRDQYRALPGDMPNAANYWPGTSNGNADSVINGDERFQFWAHLSNATLVDKNFSGSTGAGGANDFVIDTNIPGSRIKLTGFAAFYADLSATTSLYAGNFGNVISFGKTLGTNNGEPISAIFTPSDALTIDTKTDDGIPGTGKWIANLTGGGNFGSSTACATDASGSVTTGTYRTDHSTVACSFFIRTGF